MDTKITFEELTEAVRQSAAGKAPGTDDLPMDFYKRFGDILDSDL